MGSFTQLTISQFFEAMVRHPHCQFMQVDETRKQLRRLKLIKVQYIV